MSMEIAIEDPAAAHVARGVTILSAKGVGSKGFSFGADGSLRVEAYSKAREFNAHIVEVPDFEALAALLESMLDRPDDVIVLGSIKEGVNRQGMRRRSNGPDATIEDTPGHVMHIDIDGLRCPDGVDMSDDPAGAMEYARGVLVDAAPELADVKIFAALSSSAGVKTDNTVPVHLWCLLQTPLTTKQMKFWAKGVNRVASERLVGKDIGPELIDTSIYTASHIHYTARPRFGAGLHDPFQGKRRWCILAGLEERAAISVPTLDAKRPTKVTQRQQHIYAPRPGAPISIPSIKAALSCIPNNDFPWDDFKRIAMAIYAAVGDDVEAGRQLYHGWASKSCKYDAASTDVAWGEVCASPPSLITEGTLWWLSAWGKTVAAVGAHELPTDDSWKTSKTRLPATFDPPPPRAPIDQIYTSADDQIRRVFVDARFYKGQNAVDNMAAEIDFQLKPFIKNQQHFGSRKARKATLRVKKLECLIAEKISSRGFTDPRGQLFGGYLCAGATLVTADCSSGKSRAVAQAAADNPDIFIDHVSPDIELAREAFQDYEKKIGDRAALHLGMDQPDPEDPNVKMCRRSEEVKAYTAAGGRGTDLCGTKKIGLCQFSETCGYQRQINSTRHQCARVMVSAGSRSIEDHNRWVARRKDLLVIDDFPLPGLFRKEKSEEVTWNDFADPIMRDPFGNVVTEGKVFKFIDDMKPWFSAFEGEARVISAHDIIINDGCHMTPLAMRHDFAKLENVFRDLKYDVRKFEPSTNRNLIAKLKQVSKWNARMMRLSRFCRALDKRMGNRDILYASCNGSDVSIQICGYVDKDIDSIHVPTLILDATGDSYLWDLYFGHVAHEHLPLGNYCIVVEIVQVNDKLFGKTSWTPPEPPDPEKGASEEPANSKTRRNNVEELMRCLMVLDARERKKGGSMGVISYKDTHDFLQSSWPEGTPKPHMVSASKARGLNTMQDCTLLVVIGRPGVRAEDVELMAATLVGRPIVRAEYGHRTGVYYMGDGSVEPATGQEYHLDAIVERIRSQVVLAAVYQWVQRGRLARRTKPLRVMLLTSCAVPWLLVNELVSAATCFRDLTIYHHLMERGIIPLSNAHAAYGYLLGKTADAVKQAFKYDSAPEEDTRAAVNNFHSGVLGDSWSGWTLTTMTEKKYHVALEVVANDEAGAKALLSQFGLLGPEVPQNGTSNSVIPGEIPYRDYIRDFSPSDGVRGKNPGVQPDNGPLTPLFERGVYLNPSAYGAHAVFAALLGCKTTKVENMLRRYPEARERLRAGFQTDGGSLWTVKLGRHPVKVRLADVTEGGVVAAKSVLGPLAEALVLPTMAGAMEGSIASHGSNAEIVNGSGSS